MRNRWIVFPVTALLAAGSWLVYADQKPRPAKVAGSNDTTLIQHGKYLVNEVAHCGDCHTPLNNKGQLDKTRMLQGAELSFKPKKETKNWMGESPDITLNGLAGEWGEEGLVKFLMTGTDPDGMKPHPPMPIFNLNKEDARAVAQYLRSLPGKKEGSR
jgi:mono/diheme cytochrome c family protein